jgi:hypothetical protein
MIFVYTAYIMVCQETSGVLTFAVRKARWESTRRELEISGTSARMMPF